MLLPPQLPACLARAELHPGADKAGSSRCPPCATFLCLAGLRGGTDSRGMAALKRVANRSFPFSSVVSILWAPSCSIWGSPRGAACQHGVVDPVGSGCRTATMLENPTATHPQKRTCRLLRRLYHCSFPLDTCSEAAPTALAQSQISIRNGSRWRNSFGGLRCLTGCDVA